MWYIVRHGRIRLLMRRTGFFSYICTCKSGQEPATISMIYRPGRGVQLKCRAVEPWQTESCWDTCVSKLLSCQCPTEKREQHANCMLLAPIAGGSIYSIFCDCGMISPDERPPGQLMMWQEHSLPSKQSKTLCCLHRFSKRGYGYNYNLYLLYIHTWICMRSFGTGMYHISSINQIHRRNLNEHCVVVLNPFEKYLSNEIFSQVG